MISTLVYLAQERSESGLGPLVASFTTLRGWGAAKTLWWSQSTDLISFKSGRAYAVRLRKEPCPPIFRYTLIYFSTVMSLQCIYTRANIFLVRWLSNWTEWPRGIIMSSKYNAKLVTWPFPHLLKVLHCLQHVLWHGTQCTCIWSTGIHLRSDPGLELTWVAGQLVIQRV